MATITLDHIIPKVGDRLGRYELLQVLGRGGFGVVFRAQQMGLDAEVAIKVMIPQALGDDQFQWSERFMQEVKILKGLEHPATVKVRDFGHSDNDLPFFVMEFVRGKSLNDVLTDDGAMSADRVVRITDQILGSLIEAHHYGIVHRDLKPENIMLRDLVGEADSIKVFDFGISKVIGEQADVKTRTGGGVGTPHYMAPELINDFKGADGRADLYAVALIMAECLTGQRVIQATEVGSILLAHVSPNPHVFDPIVQSSGLYTVISKASAKDRENRYQGAAEMREALSTIQFTDPVGQMPSMAPQVPESRSVASSGPFQTPIAEVPISTPTLSAPPPQPSTLEPPEQLSEPRTDIPRWIPIAAVLVVAAIIIALVASSGDSESDGEQPTPDQPTNPVVETTDLPPESQTGSEEEPQTTLGSRTTMPTETEVEEYVPHGYLQVSANVGGAEIVVEGEVVGLTDAERAVLVTIRSGERQVLIRRSGWTSSEQDVSILPGREVEITAELEPPSNVSTECGDLVRVEEESNFYVMEELVSVRSFLTCVQEVGSDCRNAVEGGYRTVDDSDTCRLGDEGTIDQPVNCISQAAAEGFCRWGGLRLPTSNEWDQASRDLTINEQLWQWTSTPADEEGKVFVRGGSLDDGGPDEIDRLSHSGVVRSVAMTRFVGFRCVGDQDYLAPATLDGEDAD